MFKKLLSLLLCMIIICGMSLSVLAAPRIPVYKVGNVLYFLDKSSGTITGFAGDPQDLIVPETLGGYKVLAIGSGAFRGSQTLRTLSIPDGISIISSNAFAACTNLTSVEIGSGVTYIGSNAFGGCTSLSNVYFKGSLDNIEPDAFSGTQWITNSTEEFVILGGTTLLKYNGTQAVVRIPESVKSIGPEAFSHNDYVREIILPQSLERIGENAFVACTMLESINIPPTVLYIGTGAFDGTKWLDNQLSPFVCVNGILIAYTGLDSHITLPDGITGIGGGAFMSNSHIVSVKIPDSVIYIDTLAFASCENLISVNIPDSVEWIDEFSFSACPRLTLFGRENAYSHKYAQNMGINFSTEVYVTCNGQEIEFNSAPPVIYYERTFIPIRPVMESLGWSVLWNAEDKSVTCTFENKTLVVLPDGTISVNGEKLPELAPPIYVNGCSLVSSRVIASAIGAEVFWDAQLRTADFRF